MSSFVSVVDSSPIQMIKEHLEADTEPEFEYETSSPRELSLLLSESASDFGLRIGSDLKSRAAGMVFSGNGSNCTLY
jgi:hypothetical protein